MASLHNPLSSLGSGLMHAWCLLVCPGLQQSNSKTIDSSDATYLIKLLLVHIKFAVKFLHLSLVLLPSDP